MGDGTKQIMRPNPQPAVSRLPRGWIMIGLAGASWVLVGGVAIGIARLAKKIIR